MAPVALAVCIPDESDRLRFIQRGALVVFDFMQSSVLLAAEGKGGFGDLFLSMLPLLVIFYLFYLLFLRPQRREQSERQEMLKNMKKNDHVVTVGGIIGVVTNVDREKNEITLKVDESTNTKLRLTLGSIARVMGDEPTKPPSP